MSLTSDIAKIFTNSVQFMAMQLRDIGVYGTGKFQSEYETQVLTENGDLEELFISLIPRIYRTPNTAKISIRICPIGFEKFREFGVKMNVATCPLDVSEYITEFNFEEYRSLSQKEKKLYYWKMMCEASLATAVQLNWDNAPLQKIYEDGLLHLQSS